MSCLVSASTPSRFAFASAALNLVSIFFSELAGPLVFAVGRTTPCDGAFARE
jgi:hypothetical protein